MLDSLKSKLIVAGSMLAPAVIFAETTLPDLGQTQVATYLGEGITVLAGVIGVAVGAAVAFWVVRKAVRSIKF